MFKIYSLALLGFLSLQNSFAADQKEEFPGEASIRRRMTSQQHAVEDLQQSFKKMFQESGKNVSKLPNLPPKHENTGGNEEVSSLLASFSKMKLEQEQKIKEFERRLDWLKSNLNKENEYIIEETRREAEKQKLEREYKFEIQKLEMMQEIKDQEIKLEDQEKRFEHQLEKQKHIFEKEVEEISRKEATRYRQLGITCLLKRIDEENLPPQERNSTVSSEDFPLTFSRPYSERILLRISDEDWESLRASGVSQELIDNLFSHIQTDVSALYDMVQRGYQARNP